jgi:glutathione S-transferase
LAILDKQLAGKTYLVAERFSLAEVCATCHSWIFCH